MLIESLSKNSNLDALFNSTGKSHNTSYDKRENDQGEENKDLKAEAATFEYIPMDLEIVDDDSKKKVKKEREKNKIEKELISEI